SSRSTSHAGRVLCMALAIAATRCKWFSASAILALFCVRERLDTRLLLCVSAVEVLGKEASRFAGFNKKKKLLNLHQRLAGLRVVAAALMYKCPKPPQAVNSSADDECS